MGSQKYKGLESSEEQPEPEMKHPYAARRAYNDIEKHYDTLNKQMEQLEMDDDEKKVDDLFRSVSN